MFEKIKLLKENDQTKEKKYIKNTYIDRQILLELLNTNI